MQASDVDIGEKSGKLDHAIQIPDTLVIDPVRLEYLGLPQARITVSP